MRSEEETGRVIQEARIILGQEKTAIDADFKDKLYLAQVAASANDQFGSGEHFDNLLELEREKMSRLVKRWVELTTGLLRKRYSQLDKSDGDVIFSFCTRLLTVECATAKETLGKFFEDEVLEEGMEKLDALKRDCLIGAAIEIGHALNYLS